ncbi:hypothetical protein MBLNU230_g1193t1 [Neophaeotheca triangularis]
MGNCCSSSSDDNFKTPGRTLDGPPAQRTNAPVPTSATKKATTTPPQPPAPAPSKPKTTDKGRTLGDNNPTQTNTSGAGTTDQRASPKEAAARAAEERAARAQNSQQKGKLGKRLEAQRARTQAGTLAQGARENLAHREVDGNDKGVREWD